MMQRFTILSLLGYYTLYIPGTLLFWVLQPGVGTDAALARTNSLTNTPEITTDINSEINSDLTPTADRPAPSLIEAARQRSQQRRGLAPEKPEPSVIEDEFNLYRLGPGDTVFVNVLRFQDLSLQGTLDQQGNLVIPLVGVLTLKGLTIDQARELIRVSLDRYVVNPDVDVILVAKRPVQVTMLGEVFKPGLYPLQAPDLGTALVSAGGATRFADLRSVTIRRTLTDGSVVERQVDFYTPLRDATAMPDPHLENGDTIIVPILTAETVNGYDRELIARSTLAQQQINIRVLNYASPGGATVRAVPMPNGSNFVDALAAISPAIDNANMRKIALIRFDTEQAKAVSRELNGKKAIMGDATQNPQLEHNDVIVIGRNFAARLTRSLNTVTQPFRDVLGFLLFFDSLTQSADSLFRPSGRSRE
jgi:polysaccharide biosynthesis/export protein